MSDSHTSVSERDLIFGLGWSSGAVLVVGAITIGEGSWIGLLAIIAFLGIVGMYWTGHRNLDTDNAQEAGR